MRDLNMFCIDCNVDTDATDEFYMIHNALWKRAVLNKRHRHNRVLCIGCLETRIGRQLVASDFTDVPVNSRKNVSRSARLQQRLTAT